MIDVKIICLLVIKANGLASLNVSKIFYIGDVYHLEFLRAAKILHILTVE